MTSSREAKARIAALGEIGSILGAMKNLALMERQKAGRRLSAGQHAVDTIETAVADLSAFFAPALPEAGAYLEVYAMFGSERAFCGDFNESLVAKATRGTFERFPDATLVAVGARLIATLQASATEAVPISGACVVEEIPGVLATLAGELAALQRGAGEDRPLRLTVCFHEAGTGAVAERRVAPMPEPRVRTPSHPYPPLINLPPQELLQQLFDQYLYATLHQALYSSLAAESQQRLAHMENAMRRLDERVADLRLEYNARRQEEITEEIEVILLSAEATSVGRSGPSRAGAP